MERGHPYVIIDHCTYSHGTIRQVHPSFNSNEHATICIHGSSKGKHVRNLFISVIEKSHHKLISSFLIIVIEQADQKLTYALTHCSPNKEANKR